MYPIVLRLTGKHCLVVGGGTVARRKAEGLVAAGAAVTIVAPEIDEEVARWAARQGAAVVVVRRPYRSSDVERCWLVIAATDDPAVQQAVFDDGERAGVWVNAADDPERCAFYLPAVHRSGPVLLAVSTQGTSPALAGWLRDSLAEALPERLDELVAALGEERRAVLAEGASTEDLDWRARIEELLGRAPGPETDKS